MRRVPFCVSAFLQESCGLIVFSSFYLFSVLVLSAPRDRQKGCSVLASDIQTWPAIFCGCLISTHILLLSFCCCCTNCLFMIFLWETWALKGNEHSWGGWVSLEDSLLFLESDLLPYLAWNNVILEYYGIKRQLAIHLLTRLRLIWSQVFNGNQAQKPQYGKCLNVY